MSTLGNNMAWLLERIGEGSAPERDERPEFISFILPGSLLLNASRKRSYNRTWISMFSQKTLYLTY